LQVPGTIFSIEKQYTGKEGSKIGWLGYWGVVR